jgi:hypothetical protein
MGAGKKKVKKKNIYKKKKKNVQIFKNPRWPPAGLLKKKKNCTRYWTVGPLWQAIGKTVPVLRSTFGKKNGGVM